MVYEALVNEFFATAPATGLCLYEWNKWPAAALVHALRTHKTVVVGDAVCTGNVFYEGPEYARSDRSDTERLACMLDQLRQATARERALAEARDAAVAANRVKDDFLAALSHEMRTPLTSIVGWTSVLTRAELPPDGVRQALASIERNARGLTRMVNDLVDVSAMLAGQLSLAQKIVDAGTVVREAVETIRPIASERRLHLGVEVSSESLSIRADPDRLLQCVLNLLSNAVKFTPAEGAITARVERRDRTVVIAVSDTGIGIPSEMLPRVFDRFWRASSRPTAAGGLGLGLAITRQLVELHGGRVGVHSAGEGRGAVFTVELPAAT
jgi:signal transduction histidine kinase